MRSTTDRIAALGGDDWKYRSLLETKLSLFEHFRGTGRTQNELEDRDGSKLSQPLSTMVEDDTSATADAPAALVEALLMLPVERLRLSSLDPNRIDDALFALATICHVLNITLADLFGGIRLAHPPTTEGGTLRRANQAVLDKKPAAKRTKVPGKAASK